jgi:hypothetical protein
MKQDKVPKELLFEVEFDLCGQFYEPEERENGGCSEISVRLSVM